MVPGGFGDVPKVAPGWCMGAALNEGLGRKGRLLRRVSLGPTDALQVGMSLISFRELSAPAMGSG